MDQPIPLDEIIENSPVQDVAELTEEWKEDNKAKGGKNGRPVTPVAKALKEKKELALAEKRAEEAPEIEANRALKEAERQKMKDIAFVSPKLAAWIDEFGKNGGDVTKAALAVGTYANHASAVAAGHSFLKRAIEMGVLRNEMEKRGYHLGAMISVLLKKMEESKNLDGWDRAMKMAGYGEFIPGKNSGGAAVNINIVQDQQKDAEEFGFVEGEIVDADSDEN